MNRAAYPSDLTDEEWAAIRSVLPPPKRGRSGRPRKYPLREIWNAIFYQARTGCQWEYLPHDIPPHGDVWDHFSRWRDEGLIETVHDALRGQVRAQAGREPTPSAAIIDSQSVKTAQKGGPTATTPARRSKGASGIWRWTRWA
jgi:transposase